jgi:aspartyl-tRNA(Asn)/glutamyl-tRNA(Gln) amidotransferase subunit B
VLTGGGSIVQETRQYDGEAGTSVAMRSKEMAHDYRYFPDPDLLPVQVDAAWRATIQATIPELPYARQRRFITQYQLPYTITAVLVPERALADFFEEVAQLCGHPQAVANWLVNDLRRELAAGGIALAVSKLRPAHLAALVNLVEQGEISMTAAKEVFNDMFQTGEAPAVIVMRKNLKQSTDSGALEQWVQAAIVANPKAVAEFLAGKEQAINAVKGAVMKASQGKANPRLVDELVRRQLLAGKS